MVTNFMVIFMAVVQGRRSLQSLCRCLFAFESTSSVVDLTLTLEQQSLAVELIQRIPALRFFLIYLYTAQQVI